MSMFNVSSHQIQFMDIGGIQTVTSAALFNLPAKFVTAKPMALAVKLHDIIPPGGQKVWPGTTSDSLRELLSSLSSIYLLKQGSYGLFIRLTLVCRCLASLLN